MMAEKEHEELSDEELDELMMEQSKAPGCKKHRGYGKFDKPPVNRGLRSLLLKKMMMSAMKK